MTTQLFVQRAARHDALETEVMNIVRPFTDRRHMPDRRVAFGGIPVSFDVKTNVFVEDNSHDEYFQLWDEGELVAIIYQSDGDIYADWITFLNWAGPFPPSARSTTGDEYYRIAGGRPLREWVNTAAGEAVMLKTGSQ